MSFLNMNKKVREIEKVVAINEEVEASFKFIAVGLKNLKEQKSAIINNHVSLQLLASGIERVLKILLLIKDKHLAGSFPELQKARKRFKNYDNGHGIKKMLDELIVYSNTVGLMNRIPMVIEDMEYLKQDQNFKTFIEILTEFSIQHRYYYIDTIVLENQNGNPNPFQKFKEYICNFHEGVDVSQLTCEQEETLIISNTIICIEKGVRAISRFFTHDFDELGRKYYNDFSSFILLNDKDLGELKYAEKKKLPSENYKPISQYSFSFLRIILFSKSKTIYAKQYSDWAFTVTQVKVYSQSEKFFFTKINNEIFALTGSTSIKYKIPIYLASNKLKPRQAAVYLLDEAKKLSVIS